MSPKKKHMKVFCLLKGASERKTTDTSKETKYKNSCEGTAHSMARKLTKIRFSFIKRM